MKNQNREIIKDKISPPGKWLAPEMNLEILEDYVQPITLSAVGSKYDGTKKVLGLLFNIKRKWYVWIPKWDDLYDICLLATLIEDGNKGNTNIFTELAINILSLTQPGFMEEAYEREVHRAFHIIDGPVIEIYQKEVNEGIRPDIAKTISRYVSLEKIGGTLRGICPFCNEKEPPSFYVYPEKQIWHCMGTCDTGGDVYSFLNRIKNYSDNLKVSNLRIINTHPRHYIMNVNGKDIRLSSSELWHWNRFRAKVIDEMDFVPTKPRNWEMVLSNLLDQAEKIEAPMDTNTEAEIILSIKRWFEQRGEGMEYSDIQSGSYTVVSYRGLGTNREDRNYRAFSPTPLLRWLKRDLGKVITRDTLWSILLSWGVVEEQWRIGQMKIPVRLWALPNELFKE